MKVKIHDMYQFLLGRGIVRVYYVNGVPFAWNDMTSDEKSNPEVYMEVGHRDLITIEDIGRGSSYLIAECAHPLLFELEYTEDSIQVKDAFHDL